MTAAALAQARFSLATGVTDGPVRFNRFNGSILQRLLFAQDLERKAVSGFWFRLWWPLLSQRRFLMALVQPKGIYCFYSKQLIDGLAELIGTSSCLEIAAGDGTLTRLLRDHGVAATATDDYSWEDRVAFNDSVIRQDASAALRSRQPATVIWSWPPAANRFERDVFNTQSVQLYIVISTRHEFSSGDWATYRRQQGFEFEEVPALSRLVLPPELDPAVYVFRRTRT
ncbi:MAG: SAM-dependent methyltransferase [Acidimicrobiales bacterium]